MASHYVAVGFLCHLRSWELYPRLLATARLFHLKFVIYRKTELEKGMC